MHAGFSGGCWTTHQQERLHERFLAAAFLILSWLIAEDSSIVTLWTFCGPTRSLRCAFTSNQLKSLCLTISCRCSNNSDNQGTHNCDWLWSVSWLISRPIKWLSHCWRQAGFQKAIELLTPLKLPACQLTYECIVHGWYRLPISLNATDHFQNLQACVVDTPDALKTAYQTQALSLCD